MPRKVQCIGKTFHVGAFLVTVEDVIAEGGFAIVFLTRDAMGRRFALKRMYVNTEQDVIMCQQEIQILEELGKHPDSFIVRYFDSAINIVDEEVKEVLILLEYYKYSVLQLMNDRFQSKRHLAEEEVLNIFADICHSVGKLHTHRPAWTHRDLKVENILIDKDGHCVLCDFGSCTSRVLDPTKQSIAEIEEDLKKYTTIAYRAPEMVNLYGLKKPVTTKADIWALGVLLYKMCYFTLPFGESSLAIQNCNLQFPSVPSYSRHLTQLIRYCLKVNPDERPDIFQVAAVTCCLINRECLVPNVNRCAVMSLEALLAIPEVNQPVNVAFLEPAAPRSVRQTVQAPMEFSSTTSIAPRERPKASAPTANLVLLTPLQLRSAPESQSRDGLVRNGVSSRPGNGLGGEGVNGHDHSTGSAFRTVAPGTVNPFHLGDGSALNRPAAETTWTTRPEPLRPQKMGHRRNTSDTSMVPAPRPLSPTPTQNASEKSRSADTSPTRSPQAASEIDRKFGNWNPFNDAEIWAHIPAPPSSNVSLAHSLSSLVRGGSISSASRTTVVSPTENAARGKNLKPVALEVKKEKKKFRYQKFDNDSEEELMPDEGEEFPADGPAHKKSTEKNYPAEKVRDKDTDSIGSASDLKHEDDTTDDERASEAIKNKADNEKTEEEDNYESVQYGTLEETASAIQSVLNHQSILQETSSRPLIDRTNDKSEEDDDEGGLEHPPHPVPSGASSQRRLTFESIGLLSVFDQIPFRYPKKSKTFSALKSVDSVNGEAKIPDAQFAETNPFSTAYTSHVQPATSSDTLHDFEHIADRNTADSIIPAKLPPPVPPKPNFLQKDPGSAHRSRIPDPHDPFGPLDESHQSSRRDHIHSSTKTPRRANRSPEVSPLFPGGQAVSPKLSKSPSQRSRRIQEGISNISFEDA